MTHLERLQDLLRELFQYDVADLDFGIYRLLHLRRSEVEAFLTEQLPEQVNTAFDEVAGGEAADLEDERAKLAQRIREDLAEDALSESGEPKPEYVQTKLVQQYLSLRDKASAVQVTEERKAEVFNHLYAFFSRYYEDGDFIPHRRYGAHETYAVPYNGEEVFFHWANRDQHYVKTGEQFRDYAFTVSSMGTEYRVRFCLVEASVPKDNVKGDRRFFFPQPDAAKYVKTRRELTVPFEYRLPTEEEIATCGKDAKTQEAILGGATGEILQAVPDDVLAVALGEDQRTQAEKDDGKPEVPLLLKRLRHFAKRNTSDYFIHKDLRGFLTRELEFYLKDQVLHLDDLEGDVEGRLRVIRVIRRLAEQIIAFLSQLEDAQKRLLEKKKFVLRTDYLIPIQHVPQDFWPEVLTNKAQRQQWQEWFALDPKKDLLNPKGEVNEAFLEQHPTLVVNTAHFDGDFQRRLLEAVPFDDLDDATDGLLVHSENYQALRLLTERYREQVKCIYIDPPYNTGSDDSIYKDTYQHSSWVTMVCERLVVAKGLLQGDGALFATIDDGEVHHLRMALEKALGAQSFVANVVWHKKYARGTTRWASAHPTTMSSWLLARGLLGGRTQYLGPTSRTERTRTQTMIDEAFGSRSSTHATSRLRSARTSTTQSSTPRPARTSIRVALVCGLSIQKLTCGMSRKAVCGGV